MEQMDIVTFMAIASPASSFVGAILGMKWKQDHMAKRLDSHEEKHQVHEKRLAEHDLAIGLLKGGHQ